MSLILLKNRYRGGAEFASLYAMSSFYMIISATQTSSLTVFATTPDEALHRYEQLADGTKLHVTIYDDAGTEVTHDDLLGVADAPKNASDVGDSASQDFAIRSTASP